MNQAVNGKWYLYVVDKSAAALAEAAAGLADAGMEFGILCADPVLV